MTKIKIIWGELVKKVKRWEISKMLNYKNETKKLNDKIQELEQDIRNLIDANLGYKADRKQLQRAKTKIASLEDILKASDKALKEHSRQIKELDKTNDELLTKTFNLELEIKSKNIQIQQYEEQINDYRTEGRYLVKKVKPGRKPNTNKTKISKPTSTRVIKYMRGEHE